MSGRCAEPRRQRDRQHQVIVLAGLRGVGVAALGRQLYPKRLKLAVLRLAQRHALERDAVRRWPSPAGYPGERNVNPESPAELLGGVRGALGMGDPGCNAPGDLVELDGADAPAVARPPPPLRNRRMLSSGSHRRPPGIRTKPRNGDSARVSRHFCWYNYSLLLTSTR